MSAHEPDRYAVIGHPIAHSKSPQIHAAFAAQTGEGLVYEAREAGLETFEQETRGWLERELVGANVTLPFKERAHALADRRTAAAEQAGAVNTLIRERGPGGALRIAGDNTDGSGFMRDLVVRHGVDPAGRRVLILGAGGAVRGILGPLIATRPERIVIANRSVARAQALCAIFTELAGANACTLDACTFETVSTLAGGRFDLIVQGTSAVLGATLGDGSAPWTRWHASDLLGDQAFGYDLAYGPAAQPFLNWLAVSEKPGADGLGMLVEQAADAFERWRGRRPATDPVLVHLRVAVAATPG